MRKFSFNVLPPAKINQLNLHSPKKSSIASILPPFLAHPPRVFLAASINRIKSEVQRVEENTNTSGDVINAFTTFLVVEDCVQS